MSSFATIGAGSAKGLYNSIALNTGRVQFLTKSGSTIVQFDASISEDYGTDIDITQSPIENGSVISDHVVVKPFTFSMNGIITDTPIKDIASLLTEGATTAVSGLLGPLGTVLGGAGVAAFNAVNGSASPSLVAYIKLKQLALGTPPLAPPQPFTVVSKLGTFKNMLITSLSAPRDNKTGDSLTFRLTLTQVTIVQAASVNVSSLGDASLSSGKGELGEKGTPLDGSAFARGEVAGTF